MYAKSFVVLALAAVALGLEYPPGVDPISCPNYPYCDGVPAYPKFTPEGQPIPEWVYNPSILPVAPQDPAHHAAAAPHHPAAGWPAAHHNTEHHAPRYPAEFNPALCPNYPYCW